MAALIGVAVLLGVLLIRERQTRRRFKVLADIAAVSDSGASLVETFDAICDILVPDLADFCAIDVIDRDRVPRRAAVRAADGPGGGEWVERGLAMRRPSAPAHMLAKDRAQSLKPRFMERMTDADLQRLAQGEEDLRFLRRLAPRSTITVALNARGRITGTLTIGVAWSRRRYRPEDARFAWILSGRVALALDNAGLFANLERVERARAEIADTLQRGLLPPPLPHIPGFSIAAMYRPSGAENEVGGDFYDVFRIRGGWLLAVGDVTGRGARAASITALARYTLRTAALLSDDPLTAVDTLNRALIGRGEATLCSVVVIALSEDPTEPLRVAVAGHPPPLLTADGTVRETARPGPVLGAFARASWEIELNALAPGEQLVIVTDGIAEAKAPADGERFGELRLRRALRRVENSSRTLQLLEESLEAFTGGRLEDDVAIIALSRTPLERPAGAQLVPPAAPAAPWGGDADAAAALIGRLFDGFNRRDPEAIEALLDERMEFFPVVTPSAVGREAPYVGPDGVRAYLEDAAQVWEELRVTPNEIERKGEVLLVRGRAYAHSHERGIRDLPIAWIWVLRGGRFVRGEVFPEVERALERFRALDAEGTPVAASAR